MLNKKNIVIAVTTAVAAATAYSIIKTPKKLGPCSFELEEMAKKANEKSKADSSAPGSN